MDEEYILIGRIVASFGIRGQVKVKSETDQPDHIARKVRTLYLGDSYTPYQLVRLFEHKPGLLIMTLRDVDDRDTAEELRGSEIFIRAAEAAPLATGEYFLHELVKLQVFGEDGEPIGTVRDVMSTGSSDILIVTREGKSDALIPLVRDFVVELDIPGRRVVIRPIEGLL
ncbi:MAG: 16S rRNA processing protein RimM [Oscillochloris sp.]|nr:16S rRNA processing protein RimM [Oscillochloris sp.]